MDCPRPIKSVLPRFYPTWSSRTRPSMRIQRSEGLGSRLLKIRETYTDEAKSVMAWDQSAKVGPCSAEVAGQQ